MIKQESDSPKSHILQKRNFQMMSEESVGEKKPSEMFFKFSFGKEA
jgi:hypothetical protein